MESSDLWRPTAFGSEGCVITDASNAAHGKRAQRKCINIAGGINTGRAFSRSLTDLEGENWLSSAFPPCLSSFTLSVFLSLFFLPEGKVRHRQDSVREDLDRCSHGNKWDVAAMTTGIVLSYGVHGPASLPLATNVFLTHARPHLHFSHNLSLHHNAKTHTTIMTWELSRN